MFTTETTHPPWSRRFTAKRYGRGLSIDAAAQLIGVSAEELARLENEDPAFRAMLDEAKAMAGLSFEEQLDRADELLLDALLSFLEAGDIRVFMRAPTIMRYLRRRQAAPAAKRECGEARSDRHPGLGLKPEPGFEPADHRHPERPPLDPGLPWNLSSGRPMAGPEGCPWDDGAESASAALNPAASPPAARGPEGIEAGAAELAPETGSLIPALRGVFGEGELERSLAEIAATERRMAEPESAAELTEADWARARDTLAAAPPASPSEAEAAAQEATDLLVAGIDRLLMEPVPVKPEDIDLADAIVFTAWGRPWMYQGAFDTYRVERHIEKLRAEHRMAHPDRVTRLGSKEFREAAEALAMQARPP